MVGIGGNIPYERFTYVKFPGRNIAQSLLSKQFPKVCGFQDTVIGKLQEFDVIPTEKNYIQIVHNSSLHWVCVANMESRKKDNEIHYLIV